jgi:hypothetical protein
MKLEKNQLKRRKKTQSIRLTCETRDLGYETMTIQ